MCRALSAYHIQRQIAFAWSYFAHQAASLGISQPGSAVDMRYIHPIRILIQTRARGKGWPSRSVAASRQKEGTLYVEERDRQKEQLAKRFLSHHVQIQSSHLESVFEGLSGSRAPHPIPDIAREGKFGAFHNCEDARLT